MLNTSTFKLYCGKCNKWGDHKITNSDHLEIYECPNCHDLEINYSVSIHIPPEDNTQ